jgi:hypothetical protein
MAVPLGTLPIIGRAACMRLLIVFLGLGMMIFVLYLFVRRFLWQKINILICLGLAIHHVHHITVVDPKGLYQMTHVVLHKSTHLSKLLQVVSLW